MRPVKRKVPEWVSKLRGLMHGHVPIDATASDITLLRAREAKVAKEVKQGVPGLVKQYAAEKEPAKKAVVARELAKFTDDARTIAPLKDILKYNQTTAFWDARSDAVRRLGKLRASSAISTIAYKALSDVHPLVRLTAVRALSRMKNPKAVTHLRKALRDPNGRVKEAAAKAIAEAKKGKRKR